MGNARITSHNHGLWQVGMFNDLALWGEKKFVGELKRTYKFQRGVNNILDCHASARNDVKRHTEDNSPKYRMVGKILSILRSFAVQTRIFAKECNIIAVGYVRSTAQDDENLNRLRNKCAMTDYGHTELVSVSCGLNPSPAFQAPSAQGRQGHTHRTALRFPLSPQVARGKVSSVGNMKENIFSNMVNSLFTTNHSLIHTDKVFSRFTSHFLLRKTAFTLAEVLITLGIIGVVAALTLPALINNYEKSVVETRMQKFYTNINAALKLSIVENGDMVDWTFPQDYYDADGSEQFFNTYLKNNLQYLKTVPRVTTSWPTNGIEVDLNDGSAFVLSDTWITYYPNANKKQRSGVDSFIFIINKNGNSVIPHGYDLKLNESTIKRVEDVSYSCNGKSRKAFNRSCAAYIMQNGWKIPEYYPWGDLKKVK